MLDLCSKIKESADMEIVPENSAVGESQSNGMVERGIQDVGNQVRVLKDALETRLGVTLDPRHPILAWLISHAGALLIRCQVGVDGKTAYQRWKGKVFRKPILEFGESTHFKPIVRGRLAKSDVFLNPMIPADPAISNTHVTLTMMLCKITTIFNFTVLWLTNHRLILTTTGRTRQVISPSWFT